MYTCDFKILKQNGIIKIDNFLSEAHLNKSIDILNSLKVFKGDQKGHFKKNIKFFFFKFLQCDFKKIKDTLFFLNIEKKLFLNEIADTFFEEKSELSLVDCYISPKSDGEVLPWHVDNAYSGKTVVKNFIHPDANSLKFFFYLSDVESGNGCLSYISESHTIAFELKKGIYDGVLKYTPYWSLKDFLKTITLIENYNYISNNLGKKKLDSFIEAGFSALDKTNVSFDIPVKKGGVLIFDEAGVHRGSKPMLNDRLALRFLYKRKKIL